MNAAVFKVLDWTERRIARLRGKGYGSFSITKEVDLAIRLLGRSPRFVADIGGNVGLYSAEIRRRAPDAKIYVFEPAAVNVAALNGRFEGDRGVQIFQVAVSDEAGSAVLFSDAPGSGMGSLIKRDLDCRGIAFDCAEETTTIRFESFWQAAMDRQPLDIAKLDIEGFELHALRFI